MDWFFLRRLDLNIFRHNHFCFTFAYSILLNLSHANTLYSILVSYLSWHCLYPSPDPNPAPSPAPTSTFIPAPPLLLPRSPYPAPLPSTLTSLSCAATSMTLTRTWTSSYICRGKWQYTHNHTYVHVCLCMYICEWLSFTLITRSKATRQDDIMDFNDLFQMRRGDSCLPWY